MPTTVHIPDRLLRRIDARARALGVSRNRFLVRAVEKELDGPEQWPPELVRALTRRPAPGLTRAAAELLAAIRRGRRSRKSPPEL
jgi:predicted transcriptional regulator